MGTYNPANIGDPLHAKGSAGNRAVFTGKTTLTSALANGDKIRPCRIAGGTLVDRVVIKNDDLDSNGTPAAVCKIGYTPISGNAGDDNAFGENLTILQGAATTTYEIFPPVLVPEDSYLEIVTTTGPGTGATGDVHGKVEGEARGIA